jgi:membrane protein YdbS with pleckstrin-like domain
MNMIYWTLAALGVFLAIWFLFVVPAERRHHERKLAILKKRIEERQSRSGAGDTDEQQARNAEAAE